MFKNLTTLVTWVIAGPNAAVKTHSLISNIERSRARRTVITWDPAKDEQFKIRIQSHLEALARR